MSDLLELPKVSECTAAGCSYNDHDHCKAPAITVGQGSACVTFIPLSIKGGLDTVISHVGACQRADCSLNSNLECTADSIVVGAGRDQADCLTFTAA